MGKELQLTNTLLYGGISQRPGYLQFDGQVSDATNADFSVIDGIRRRSGTAFLCEISGLDKDIPYRLHAIERNAEEKYFALYGNGGIKVFESDGRPCTVTITQDAQTYLDFNSPDTKDIKLMSAEQYTFIVNTQSPLDANPSLGTLIDTQMPLKLERTAKATPSTQATFTVDTINWTARAKGDDTNNPAPSLWQDNDTLSDIIFYNNRLVLVGKDRIVMSQVGQIFNFYIADPTNITDADPVDVGIASDEVALIDSITPYHQSLLIFTKSGSQFILSHKGALSPTTVFIQPISNYKTLNIKPLAFGGASYFIGRRGQKSAMYYLYYNDNRQTHNAINLSQQTPHLLPWAVRRIIGSVNNQHVIVLPTGTVQHEMQGTPPGDSLILAENHHKLITQKKVLVSNSTKTTNQIIENYVFLSTEKGDKLVTSQGTYIATSASLPPSIKYDTDTNQHYEIQKLGALAYFDENGTPPSVVYVGGSKLFTYQANWTDGKRAQSAWSHYQFPDDYRIADICNIEDYTYMLVCQNDKWFVETMPMAQTLRPTQPLNHQLTLPGGSEQGRSPHYITGTLARYDWTVHLDRAMQGESVNDGKLTKITLPGSNAGVNMVVLSTDFAEAGKILAVASKDNGTSIWVAGNYGQGRVMAGRSFLTQISPTLPYANDKTGKPDIDAYLQLRKISVGYHNTGWMQVDRQMPGRVRWFKNAEFKQPQSGELDAWFNGNLKEMDINIGTNSPLPMTATSIKYTAYYEPRGAQT